MISPFDHALLAPDSWIQACEACLRASNLGALAPLLEQLPGPEYMPDVSFYRARIAIGEADFEAAIKLLRKASHEAGIQSHTVLHQRSLIWEAYVESQRGNYGRAQELVDDVEQMVSPDDPLSADVFFIRGLIAAEQGTFPTAQRWMEQARSVAVRFHDDWMEARCCANLAVIYSSQALLDHALRMIRRVEQINASDGYTPNPQQLIQVRNTHIRNLHWRGELERALHRTEPLPEPKEDGSRLFAGYLTLTMAMVLTDSGDFSRAEQVWQRAYELLRMVTDDQRTMAELFWERAWLRLRQGNLEAAHKDSQEALYLIDDGMETECYHAYVIAAIISIRRNDFGTIGLILRQASERFRKVGHRMGLLSVLLHIAAYSLQRGRLTPGREALAEALTLMWTHQVYGTYYWDPSIMVYLCREAIQEEIWGDQAVALAVRFFGISEAEVHEKFQLEGGPAGLWGEFAASLAVRRLGLDYWRDFTPLLNHPQSYVRRRAAQVVHAARDVQAQAALECLCEDLDPEVRQYAPASTNIPPIEIFSFGQFKLLIKGQPLQLRGASTRKTLVIFGSLLLAGERGMESSDLALLLWPEKPVRARSGALQTTISYLRAELRRVFDSENRDKVITSSGGRYYLHLQEKDRWWDWHELERIALQKQIEAQHLRMAEQLYQESFMDLFSQLLPPENLEQATELYWDRVAQSLCNLATDHQIQADTWIAEIREKAGICDTDIQVQPSHC